MANWGNVPLTLVLALIGLFTGLGVYKATVGYLAERSKKMDDNFATLQGEMAGVNQSVTEIRTVLTGMTGRDGLLGDMSEIQKDVRANQLKIAQIQAHISLEDE